MGVYEVLGDDGRLSVRAALDGELHLHGAYVWMYKKQTVFVECEFRKGLLHGRYRRFHHGSGRVVCQYTFNRGARVVSSTDIEEGRLDRDYSDQWTHAFSDGGLSDLQ